MFRFCFFLLFTLLSESVLAASSVVFGFSSLPFTVIPIVAIYSAFFYLPFEAIVTAAGVGFIVDCLGGSPIGFNILAQIILWLICALLAAWIGKPRWLIVFGFAVFSSFLYRIILYLIAGAFGSISTNFNLPALLLAPLLDGAVGYFLLKRVINVFTKSDICEPGLISSPHVTVR